MSVLASRSRASRLLIVLATFAVAVHLFGLYRLSGPPSASWFPNLDKVEHLLGFGAPVLLLLLAGARWEPAGARRPSRRFTGVVVGAFALHGVVSELIQHYFYADRTGDPADVLADWSGVVLGGAVAWLVLRRRTPGRRAVPG